MTLKAKGLHRVCVPDSGNLGDILEFCFPPDLFLKISDERELILKITKLFHYLHNFYSSFFLI